METREEILQGSLDPHYATSNIHHCTLRFKNKPSGPSLISQTCERGTKCQQLWCFSIFNSWRHSTPNANIASVSNDYESKARECV